MHVQRHKMEQKGKEFKPFYAWRNILAFIYFHSTIFYMIYMWLTLEKIPWMSILTGTLIGACSEIFGVIIGAHRMWSHKSFKARWPLRLFLGFWQTVAGQNSIYEWCRDHRVHHKFSDTDADPHNINNGFFFAHMGWLCIEKHPDVKKKGKTLDLSDLEKDWVVMFQKKYYEVFYVLFAHIAPTLSLYYFHNIPLIMAFHGNLFRYVITLHITWATNSFAHSVGNHPYDKNLLASEFSQFAWFAGEWWHNFHHAFPWDYKMSEQVHWELTFIWRIIDFFAYIGQAYDLKTVSQDMIKKRVLRTGDGTHPYSKMQNENNNVEIPTKEQTNHYWGWDDKSVAEDDKKLTIISNLNKQKNI